ncbi:MAG: hypothetical protein OXT65_05000 [Alphaproteobacteria bacterium]|nr:hypothetical protein [Alphaproteobacteria bacterium]
MADMIDLSPDGNTPVLVNPAEVTAIRAFPKTDWQEPHVMIYGRNGVLARCDGATLADSEDMAQKVRAAGHPLLRMPIEPLGSAESRDFYALSAIGFLSVSVNMVSDNSSLVIACAGVPDACMYSVSFDKRDDISIALMSKKPDMVVVDRKEAELVPYHFSEFLLIDPRFLSSVSESNTDISLRVCGQELGIRPRAAVDRNRQVSQLGLALHKKNDRQDLTAAMSEARKIIDADIAQYRRDLMARIVEANPDLVPVEGAQSSAYVHRSDIDTVTACDDAKSYRLKVCFKAAHDGTVPSITSVFETKAARQLAENRLRHVLKGSGPRRP